MKTFIMSVDNASGHKLHTRMYKTQAETPTEAFTKVVVHENCGSVSSPKSGVVYYNEDEERELLYLDHDLGNLHWFGDDIQALIFEIEDIEKI